jgi:hypothetical protein
MRAGTDSWAHSESERRSVHRFRCERRQTERMASRVEQHLPPRVPLLWQRGSQCQSPPRSRAEIVGGEVEVNDRGPWPRRGDMPVDPLRYEYRPGHLDPDAGLLRPQLAATEQAQVEVCKLQGVGTVQRDAHQSRRADLCHSGTLRPVHGLCGYLANVRICRDQGGRRLRRPAVGRHGQGVRRVRGGHRRLHTNHIDLYQMHHVGRQAPWEEVWQAMEQLVREGKVRYVGDSSCAAWDVALARAAASARHFLGLTSEQSLYNLAVRTVEDGCRVARRMLPWLGCCTTPSCPRPSSGCGRPKSCGRTSVSCRSSWTWSSWIASTRSSRVQEKPHRRTPGEASPSAQRAACEKAVTTVTMQGTSSAT